MVAPSAVTGAALSVRTNDVDEARSICQSFYYPVRLTPRGPTAAFAFNVDVSHVGPLTLGSLRFGSEVESRNDDLGSAYHVSIPLAGYGEMRHRNRTVFASATCAPVYRPVGGIASRCSANWRGIAVKIDRAALENELHSILGHPAETPLRLAPSLDLSQPAGHSWAQLVRLLYSELANQQSLANQPQVAEHLSHSVLAGFLFTVDHQHRERLAATRPPGPRSAVIRVLDLMHEDPARAYTATELAKISGVGTRALQQSFQRHVGLAPMAYLRQVRLDRAQAQLSRPPSADTTVADIAHRWGFAHLGRFAAAYRARFGSTPSQTLHRKQQTRGAILLGAGSRRITK
jgi:AraC-like DNA-binding protein